MSFEPSKQYQIDFAGTPLIVETGKVAKQASGAVWLRYGDSIVLLTAVTDPSRKSVSQDFMPLTCDYIERSFSAGKIPGGFFKREGKPSERETLVSRFIDRPIRPLFPEGFRCETQIMASVLSYSEENDPDVLAISGASMALMISDIPFNGPIVGVRVCRNNGELVANPPAVTYEKAELNIVVACTKDSVVMVEGGCKEASEQQMMDAIRFAHQTAQPLIELQLRMQQEIGKPKIALDMPVVDQDLKKRVQELAKQGLLDALRIKEKQGRNQAKKKIIQTTQEALAETYPERQIEIAAMLEEIVYDGMRRMILEEGVRVDGRRSDEVRPITCEVGLLPRVHGSALFTRGETQAIVTVTLGSAEDEQKIDALLGETYKWFILHYNFFPFSVGEVKPLRSPGRREIGHGALSERAIKQMLPSHDDFPYTIRVVSDILESNGSSSQATICGSSLALMDAGVPIQSQVAGIAMGLISSPNKSVVLSDILGDEDHLGDMDFKVAGTEKGITAFQLDCKISGLPMNVMESALEQARTGRLHILSIMNQTMMQSRGKLSVYAPKIRIMEIKPEKIKDLIGPGGKHIKAIIEETGAKIDVEDSGRVNIFAVGNESMEKAVRLVQEYTGDINIEELVKVGEVYDGLVRKVVDFGAFVQILPNIDGLVHISQLAHNRVRSVTDVVREGDRLKVKVLEIDKTGRIRLSHKDTLSPPDRTSTPPQHHGR